MQALNAIDAISPAWNHARRIMLAPRSWRLALKIGAVAFFARAGGCNGNYHSSGGHNYAHNLPPAFIALLVSLLVVIVIVSLVIALAFFYLGSRLQFVLFEVVLRSDTTVAPIWRRYSRATWYWIGLKLAYFAIALLCAAPILVPLVIHLIHTWHAGGASPDFARMFLSILGFIGTIFLIVLVIGLGYTLLSDFGLPSMALESTPLGITVQRVWRLVLAEPLQVLLYLLMRFLMSLAGVIASYIALFFMILAACIPLGGAALIAWLSFRNGGIASHAAMIASWVVLGLILIAFIIVAAIMLFGYIFVFLQAYAIYFLGGRYPMLGDILERSTPSLYPPPTGYAPPPPAWNPVPPQS